MSETAFSWRKIAGITCIVHYSLRKKVIDHLERMGVDTIYVEVGKNVRQKIQSRFFGLLGIYQTLQDSPAEVFRFSVSSDDSTYVINSLISAVELHIQGRGMIFSQDMLEYSKQKLPELKKEEEFESNYSLLPDLSLITCILSKPGSGKRLSKIALELGTCVPIVMNGKGTGMRDYLGLLRITIPPEKEIVQLIVPEYDADNIIRLLIEEVKLNLPGRGFLYRTQVSRGLVDTKLRIGHQEHAASIEQIISAIDDLKAGTHWRRRFNRIGQNYLSGSPRLLYRYKSIIFMCKEGKGNALVKAAMEVGARGATISRVSRLNLQTKEDNTAAGERNIICVPDNISQEVTEALVNSDNMKTEQHVDSIRVQDSPTVFTYTT